VAQPSLSAQVAVAERALGLQLFERAGRRVRVPSAATSVIAQARKVLMAAGDLRELARHNADPFGGTLRLGVIPTVCPYLLPDITRPLAHDLPNLTLAWTEDRTARLVRHVREGTLDGALVARDASLKGLAHADLAWDPFLLVASRDHALGRAKKRVTPDVLDGERVLLLDDGHCFRDQALELCARAGAREGGFRATSLTTLVQMVRTSGGVTLLPAIALPVENRRGQLAVRAFASPSPGRTLALVWRRGTSRRAPLERIAGTIRKTMRR
jgi:LysR family hydrogen peroxide-inducible transcriptional activator